MSYRRIPVTNVPLVNHRFVLAQARQRGGRILDFGCGAGEVVAAGLSMGLDIWGAEDYSAAAHGVTGSSAERRAATRIVETSGSLPLPFPAGHFDFVFSNQVFEHVANLEFTIRELARVLKTGGTMLHVFPSVGVLREGHFGVPLSHYVARTPLSRAYLSLAYRMHVGKHRAHTPRVEWVTIADTFIKHRCYYRTERRVFNAFRSAGLSVRHDELAYVLFRLGHESTLAFRLARPLVERLFRLLGGMVLDCKKLDTSGPSSI